MSGKNGQGPKIGWEQVTPAEALDWLERCNTENRPVSESVVGQYARDMKEGRWHARSTTPIKFDWDGVLVDGQHRLWAVVESGEAVEFLVVRNCDPAERRVQDIGKKRNVSDLMAFDGGRVGKVAVAVSNRVAESFTKGYRPTMTEQQETVREHAEAVGWVLEQLGRNMRGIGQASVLAPIARAWYTCDRERLAQFVEILKTGMTTQAGDMTAILFRNHVLNLRKGISGHAVREETYGKCERAILAFLKREALAKLVAVSEEQFPIPSEQRGVSLRGKKRVSRKVRNAGEKARGTKR